MLKELEEYICSLDSIDCRIIDNRVAEKGIENYLIQQLIYLDCSRIINNTRMMQTIGYPYQRELTSYLYALENYSTDKTTWEEKLLDRHKNNIEYEKENPPVWYGGEKAKAKWNREHNKLPRRKKVSEGIIPGIGKELSNTERLKRLSAQFGKLTFNIKPKNK